MTTLAALIEQTRQRIRPGRRDTLNKLAAAIGTSDTTFAVRYDGLAPQQRISIDLEDFYLWDVAAATKTVAACERGFNGSTAAAHINGSLVHVNAEFSAFEILRAVNETLRALPGEGIYQFLTVDLVDSPTTIGYDLTGVDDLLGVHRVRSKDLAGLGGWTPVTREMWTVRQSMPSGDFASGEALFIYGDVSPGTTLEVLYRAPFQELEALNDDVEDDAGLPASMHALLVVGAALRLTQGRALERSALDAQGVTRRPTEVTTTDARSAASPLELEWQRGVQRARREQLRKHGA